MENLASTFGLLASQRRLYTLEILSESGPMAMSDLAAEIAALEAGEPPDSVGEPHLSRVVTSLRHNHLPKLAEAGVVQWNQSGSRVRLGENAEDAVGVVDAVFET